jgi:glycosyltransferase involved in cell wall biosynthesis
VLQGEDTFLDALPSGLRENAWRLLAERAKDVDLFVAPSNYYASAMQERLRIPDAKMNVVYNGINLEGFKPAGSRPHPPVLGYFARMCREKGLDTLVDAYMILRKRNRIPGLRLKVGGGCGPADESFVTELERKLEAAGLIQDVEFRPNLGREAKQKLIKSFSVFSVPALYGEAFGLYLLEAWACGVPVVQPRHAAFPELVATTGGGIVCEPGNTEALADAIEQLLLDPVQASSMGNAGRSAVLTEFSTERMAERLLQVYGQNTAELIRPDARKDLAAGPL